MGADPLEAPEPPVTQINRGHTVLADQKRKVRVRNVVGTNLLARRRVVPLLEAFRFVGGPDLWAFEQGRNVGGRLSEGQWPRQDARMSDDAEIAHDGGPEQVHEVRASGEPLDDGSSTRMRRV